MLHVMPVAQLTIYSCIMQMLSVQHRESENTLQDSQQVNHSDMEVIKESRPPGQCSASELVHEHNVSATCSPDSVGGSSPPGLLMESAEQPLNSDVERRTCSQANCCDPRKSIQLSPASMLQSSAHFVSCENLGASREPMSKGVVDCTEEVHMVNQSNSCDTDLGEDDGSGIPLVVDLPIQKEQCPAG